MPVIHPLNANAPRIEGEIIGKGSTLKATDLYASTSGRWESCPESCVGILLPKTPTLWVRPATAVPR